VLHFLGANQLGSAFGLAISNDLIAGQRRFNPIPHISEIEPNSATNKQYRILKKYGQTVAKLSKKRD
jgi:hypothetical protein